MNRNSKYWAAVAVLLLMPTLALSVPVINSITPSKSSANTGATVNILGTGFGSLSDLVYFPDGTAEHVVNPEALISGGVRVRVPPTWSGDVRIQAYGAGTLSNGVNHDIYYSYSGTRWFSTPFTWYLNVSGAPGCTFTATRDALVRGYDAWECASGLSTTYGGSTGIGVTSQDGINCRYWSSSGWGAGTIAVASWWYYTATGEIVEADIGFNAQYYTWSCSGAAGDMDVGNIGTHEEGHTIGLLDMYGAADSEKTMYGYGATGETKKQTLSRDDVYGAEFMYSHTRANFVHTTPSGWSYPLVPRNTNDGTFASSLLPASLNGNTTSYINAAYTNSGADCAAPHGLNRLYLDDAYVYWNSWGGVWGAGYTSSYNNMGVTVRGGRHTLKHVLDYDDETVESSESDNTYQRQFVWQPYTLSDYTPLSRYAPPERGPYTYYNCDGFAFSTGGTWWGCVGLMPLGSGDDYDLRLHDESPSSLNGFDTFVAQSSWGGAVSDFVLVNGNTGGGSSITRWAGVNRYSGGSGSFYVQLGRNRGTITAPLTSSTYAMAGYDIVGMHEVYLGTTTSWDFTLMNLTGTANLGFAIYDQAGTHFAKSNYERYANSHGDGLDESFTFDAPATGFYGVVVFKNGYGDMGKSGTYRLDVQLTPPNLRPNYVSGWDSPLVLRNDNTAAPGDVHVSGVLDGNTLNTYASVTGINDGPNPASQNNTRIYFDNVSSGWINWGLISAGTQYSYYNLGAFNIRGGRHMVEWRNDWDDAVAESNESDNSHRRQYVWLPYELTDQVAVVRATPPDNGYSEGFSYPNCDGFEFTWSGFWGAVGCLPSSGSADYDVRLHNDSPSSQNGFDTYNAWSSWSSGYSDFVLVNGDNAGGSTGTRQAGVYNYNGGSGSMAVQQSNRVALLAAPVSTGSYSLTANMVLQVFEIYIGTTGHYTFDLDQTAGTCNLGFSLFDEAGSYFTKSNSMVMGNSAGDGGDETFSIQIDTPGYYGLVVWKNAYGDYGKASTYNLGISLTPPNLTTITASGWDYPVVVRNDNTASVGDVHVSSVLDGNTSNTYFNVSGINDGPNPADHNNTCLFLDESDIWIIGWTTINAGQSYARINGGAIASRGGRHTVMWVNDWDETVEELDEGDNVYGRQFVWSPLVLADETPVIRAAPPVMGSGIYPNSDGFQRNTAAGYAWVAALGPAAATDDYDLRVYTNYAGSQSGFTALHGYSSYNHGYVDYVGGSSATAGVPFYPAAVLYGGGTGSFTQDTADSRPDKVSSTPANWPFEKLNAGRLVDIFEVDLDAGIEYTMALGNNTGGADLAVHAFRPSTANINAATAMYRWDTGGAGAGETAKFTPTESGYHAFVVFKRTHVDIPLNTGYSFRIVDELASVEEERALPTRFALAKNTPNPFNPKTVIRFEIPNPGSQVRLDIYDLKGRLVRRLVDDAYPAGRFEAVWEGRNDKGEPQSSGLFIYRMVAGSFEQSGIMTLVK